MDGDMLSDALGRTNSQPVKYMSRVDDMVVHVGAYLQTHETMGWANAELAATVKVVKDAREAARAEAKAKIVAEHLALDTEIFRVFNMMNGLDQAACDQVILQLEAPAITDRLRFLGSQGARFLPLERQVAFDPEQILASYWSALERRDGVEGENVALAFRHAELAARAAARLREGRIHRFVQQAAERDAFEVSPWLGTSVRIDPIPADPEAMPANQSIQGNRGGQGRIGSIVRGMSADEMLAGSARITGTRQYRDGISPYQAAIVDFIERYQASAIAAGGIALDASVPPSDDSAPAASKPT
jgi:hypothetical protein